MASKPDGMIICFSPTMITTDGIWQGDNPLDYSLPLFILQLTIIVALTRLLVFLLKPLHQPRVISEILGGVILGPSILGRSSRFANIVFPLRSVMVLETMANVGLLFFLFLVGVEMDLAVVRRTGKKAMAISLSGMVIPFIIGVCFSFLIHRKNSTVSQGNFVLFFCVALSVTAFPVLSRILAELKLLNTEIGRVSLSAALFNDMCAWVFLALAIALSENQKHSLASLWVILSSAAFVTFCIFVVRPAVSWLIQRNPEGESFSELQLYMILTGVMIAGFITDAMGTHSVFGAFIFGLVIPNGPLGVTLIEKLEDFVSGLLLPLFFAISGLKTDIASIEGAGTWSALILVIVLAFAGKVGGTILATRFYQMPYREGMTLGLLMNTKGLVEIILINIGKDHNVLDDQSFAILVFVAAAMTALISPFVTIIYKPPKRRASYKKRTIQSSKSDSEFRVLVCIHTPRNVPTIINLLDASYPTKKSPICIYVLQLVELTSRASAMLIVHNTRKSSRPVLNRTEAQSDHIINAFQNYEQYAGFVSVQPLTAISPYSTMHDDISNLAEDKRVGLIIIPFHKQQTVDGGMEATNPAFRTMNRNLLVNAPCSVGILVDRGLSGSNRFAANQLSHHVVVVFFGGPDDREALSYGWRMAEHPGINLTVMRLIPRQDIPSDHQIASDLKNSSKLTLTLETDTKRERQLDEEYINEFRTKNSDDESIAYIEQVVNNGEETVAALRSIDNTAHDLFIVGRGKGMISPLQAGMNDWSECPELGAIGDLLASTDFTANFSVLVVQQYNGNEEIEEGNYVDEQQLGNVVTPMIQWPKGTPSTDQQYVFNASPQL